MSNLSNLLFKSLKLVRKLSSLSISNLSTIDSKLAKSAFLNSNFSAKSDVSTPVAFLNLSLLHNQTNLIQLSYFPVKNLVLENLHSFILCFFYQSN